MIMNSTMLLALAQDGTVMAPVSTSVWLANMPTIGAALPGDQFRAIAGAYFLSPMADRILQSFLDGRAISSGDHESLRKMSDDFQHAAHMLGRRYWPDYR
jgi:hypothetical protein